MITTYSESCAQATEQSHIEEANKVSEMLIQSYGCDQQREFIEQVKWVIDKHYQRRIEEQEKDLAVLKESHQNFLGFPKQD